MPTTINNIKFIDLYLSLFDPAHAEKLGLSVEEWDAIKLQWEKENPVESERIEMQKSIFSDTLEYNKLRLLVLKLQINPDTKIFDDIGMRHMTAEEMIAKMKKLDARSNITVARLSQLADETPASSDPQLEYIYECIASLEPHGFNIPDYNELTYSKYRAMTKIIERNGRKN